MASYFVAIVVLTVVLNNAEAENELGVQFDPLYCNATSSCLTFPARITSKHYYLNIVNKVNWYKAHQFCTLHGMRLATILTEQQNKEILELMTANGVQDAWFGLTDLGDEGSFFNIGTGALVNYTDWLPNKPNNKGWADKPENCVRIRTWDDGRVGWDDDMCEDPFYFACDLASK